MAQQNINIGAAPNDNTGDALRDGGQKINENFTELYNHVGQSDNPHSVTKGQIGLSLVINALQVINAGGFISLMADAIASRPAAAQAGRFFYATDTDQLYMDDGDSWNEILITNLADHAALINNPHGVTKTQVGLSNVTNDAQIPSALKGAANGVAELDGNTLVPLAQLPYIPNPATNKDANYTSTANDYYIGVTTVPLTITLPPSANVPDGFELIIKDEAGGSTTNNITVSPDGTDTIEGAAASQTIDTDFGFIKLIKRGTNWNII